MAIILLTMSVGCITRDAPQEQSPPGGNPAATQANEIANVRFVDKVGDNFLFRGAHPVAEPSGGPPVFDDGALQAALRNASRSAGKELPPSFTLVDISLLWPDNPTDNNRERAILRAEDAYFASHPAAGRLRLWPVHGTELPPSDPSIAVCRDYLADHFDAWSGDSLVKRVETVRHYLEDPAAEGLQSPLVVYVHCYGGCDRTGEIIGAYSLRYLNMSWEEIRDANGRQCRPERAYDAANCNALQWYGLWLNRTQGLPVHVDADPPCFRPGVK